MYKLIIALLIITCTCTSCRLWQKVFPPKYGCKTSGKNVGAEQLLGSDKDSKKAIKAAKKAKRFKA